MIDLFFSADVSWFSPSRDIMQLPRGPICVILRKSEEPQESCAGRGDAVREQEPELPETAKGGYV